MTLEWLQKLREQRKIKEQQKLLEALRRSEKEPRRRPAMKFASNTIRKT